MGAFTRRLIVVGGFVYIFGGGRSEVGEWMCVYVRRCYLGRIRAGIGFFSRTFGEYSIWRGEMSD